MMCRLVANGDDEFTCLNFQSHDMDGGNINDYALCQDSGAGRMARNVSPLGMQIAARQWIRQTTEWKIEGEMDSLLIR